ncbi:MAG: ribosomal subunit interface protein [Candidatus Bathyarchaeota archaeon B26-2]|nr:MAG: ribosomal subunit interface protein [Candidatus Bathyarchaeota archaeon B26-2]
MIEIDGSQKSGSGTILRLSVALAGITGEPLHIYNIRKRRSRPGLRPQHLEAVLTAARLCRADLKGATLGSLELWFEPRDIEGGDFEAEIGTAGSIPMLIMTVLPLCIYAKRTVRLRISKGGTDVSHAPTINYMKYVLVPTLRRMGVEASIEVKRYGYYPKGMGEVYLEVQPTKRLKPINLEEFGSVEKVQGVSVCTFLADRRVAERQAKAAAQYLKPHGYDPMIKVVNDFSNPLQKGSSIVLWAETSSGVLLGSDAIGELRKLSEAVGREAAESLLTEMKSEATVDTHLADMLIPYIALAEGGSTYLTRTVTDHLETNIWLTRKILGVDIRAEKTDGRYRIVKRPS